MFGPDGFATEGVPKREMGIVPRACENIFSTIEEARIRTPMSRFEVSGSYMEIYNERVRDLLDVGNEFLKVHETPGRGVYVHGLAEEQINSTEDVYAMLEVGGRHRSIAATRMNERSSRSHTLFVLQVTHRSSEDSVRHGKLNLVDLAGSEKVWKTGATGNVLTEAKAINRSLSALGNCINALTKDAPGTHVPFRDSKLTRILQVCMCIWYM